MESQSISKDKRHNKASKRTNKMIEDENNIHDKLRYWCMNNRNDIGMEIVLRESGLELKVSPELVEWWEVMARAEDRRREQERY